MKNRSRLPLFENFGVPATRKGSKKSRRSKGRRPRRTVSEASTFGHEFFSDMLDKFVDTMDKDEKNAVALIAYLNDEHPSSYEGYGVFDEASNFFTEDLPYDYTDKEVLDIKRHLDNADFVGMLNVVKKHFGDA